jgi:hypothetical protein
MFGLIWQESMVFPRIQFAISSHEKMRTRKNANKTKAAFNGQMFPKWGRRIFSRSRKKNLDKMLDSNAVFAGQVVSQWDHLNSHVSL